MRHMRRQPRDIDDDGLPVALKVGVEGKDFENRGFRSALDLAASGRASLKRGCIFNHDIRASQHH